MRPRSQRNVVQGRQFSEHLDAAIARHHTNAISTVEILQELIDLAREIRAARPRRCRPDGRVEHDRLWICPWADPGAHQAQKKMIPPSEMVFVSRSP
ncbi:type I restriction enzyme endonuclease domain-containing protein [Thiobaca trueperi]|uniref:type I restriction enzyme endonuclease domain-containing protein n=1 Tax=Thiobaca trueperi TaxID=127458 RepID=UPI001FB21B42|nr:type I restriction enzyme endonuclease domain-containing protein [Thiobaca trueperi]